MKKITIQFFFLGLIIAFTISILTVSVIMGVTTENATIPVNFVWQSFTLSALCSLINLVYRSEKLSFAWQSLLGYLLTTTTIITCGLIFHWYGYGEDSWGRGFFTFILFFICSLCYLVTWIIIYKITQSKKRELNDKLREYKEKQ